MKYKYKYTKQENENTHQIEKFENHNTTTRKKTNNKQHKQHKQHSEYRKTDYSKQNTKLNSRKIQNPEG